MINLFSILYQFFSVRVSIETNKIFVKDSSLFFRFSFMFLLNLICFHTSKMMAEYLFLMLNITSRGLTPAGIIFFIISYNIPFWMIVIEILIFFQVHKISSCTCCCDASNGCDKIKEPSFKFLHIVCPWILVFILHFIY